jgi:hypothetical protein
LTEAIERYSFYRALTVERDAAKAEIAGAHEQAVSALEPAAGTDEQKRAVVLARIVADTAQAVLIDEESRALYDAKIAEAEKAESAKTKLESKRAGKLQEEQTIEEDVKLQKATVKYESALGALADFYYDRLFDAARETVFEAVPKEKVLEWLSAERAEAIRKAEQKGRKTSFRIDWEGFASVQDKRKTRGEEIAGIIENLVQELQLP